jgi:toxin FitB
LGEVLVDTDVLVDHLRGARRLQTTPGSFAYSVITRTELFAGSGTDEGRVRVLLAPMREIVVDRAIAERAGGLRRTLPILTPDALIAATALELDVPLMTRNRRDFEAVPGLTILAPPRKSQEPREAS